MFSGIVETIGRLVNVIIDQGCYHLTIEPATRFTDLIIGESIAINGVCLTVTHFTLDFFHITAVPETLRLTNLHKLKVGSLVNLERSLKLGDRMGGHYVQGHVDGLGEITSIRKDASEALLVDIRIPDNLTRYVVRKGYITLDGMSITIVDAIDNIVTVTFIPHTQAVTTIKDYQSGTLINIEVDILGKYVEKLLEAQTYAIRP